MIDQGLKKTQPIAPRKSQSQRSTGDVLRREGPFMGNKPAGSSPRSTRTCNLREFRMRTSRVDTEPLHRTRGGGLGGGRGQVLIDLLRRKIVHFPIFWWHFVPWPSIGSPFRMLLRSASPAESHILLFLDRSTSVGVSSKAVREYLYLAICQPHLHGR